MTRRPHILATLARVAAGQVRDYIRDRMWRWERVR